MIPTSVMAAVPADLQLKLSSYFTESEIRLESASTVDVVLALLRVGGTEGRTIAEEISGVRIKVVPANPPPWPPKPVKRPPRTVLVRRDPNPCLPTTDAFQRYRRLRLGLTKEQLLSRGVTSRDLGYWSKKGAIEFGVRA